MSGVEDAQLAEAQAKARAAQAAADAAEEARQQAVADRETAELTRDKTRAENAEWLAGAGDREREAAQKARTADLDNLTKLQSVAKDATPDLGSVPRGEFAKPDDAVVFGTRLKVAALADAAGKVMRAVKALGVDKYRVFVTADPALLDRDAFREGLVTRMSGLAETVAQFPQPGGGDASKSLTGVDGALAALTAAAKLVPGVLGLFAVNRKLTTQELSVADADAVAAVAGALALAETGERVVTDAFRFLRDDPEPAARVSAVFGARDRLQDALVTIQGSVASESAKPAAEQDALWLAAAASIVTSVREVLASAETVPAGSTISPLAAAAAVEQIRLAGYHGVLLVRSIGSSAVELTADRSLAVKDTLHAIGTVALSFTVIDPADSHVLTGGAVAGYAEVTARLGSTIDLSWGTPQQ